MDVNLVWHELCCCLTKLPSWPGCDCSVLACLLSPFKHFGYKSYNLKVKSYWVYFGKNSFDCFDNFYASWGTPCFFVKWNSLPWGLIGPIFKNKLGRFHGLEARLICRDTEWELGRSGWSQEARWALRVTGVSVCRMALLVLFHITSDHKPPEQWLWMKVSAVCF